MSDTSNTASLSGLFTKLHGGKAVPIRFEMISSAERAQITQIIKLGGGEISGKSSEGSIRLANSDWPVVEAGSVDYRYVLECAKKAKLLDCKKFLLQPKGGTKKQSSGANVLPTASRNSSAVARANDTAVSSDYTASVIYSDRDEEETNVEAGVDENAQVEVEPETTKAANNSATKAKGQTSNGPKRAKNRSNRGKHIKRYTFDEDRKLVAFAALEENASRVRTNTLWIEAEQNAVLPGRSYASMRDHFLEVILPRIRSFAPIVPESSMRAFLRKGHVNSPSSLNKTPLRIVTDKLGADTPRHADARSRSLAAQSNVNSMEHDDSFEVDISDPDESQLEPPPRDDSRSYTVPKQKALSTSVPDSAYRRTADADAQDAVSAEVQLLVHSAPRPSDAEQQGASSSHLAEQNSANATSDSRAAPHSDTMMRSDSVENFMCCMDTQEAFTINQELNKQTEAARPSSASPKQLQIDMDTSTNSNTKANSSANDPEARTTAQQPEAESVVVNTSQRKEQQETANTVRPMTRVGAFRNQLARHIAILDARLQSHQTVSSKEQPVARTSANQAGEPPTHRSSLDDLATQQSEFERALRSVPTDEQSPRTLMCSTQIDDVPAARTRGRAAATSSFDHAVIVGVVNAASQHQRLSEAQSTSSISTSYRSAHTSLSSPRSDDADRSQNTTRPTIILAPDSTMFEQTADLPDQSPSTSGHRGTQAKNISILHASPTRSNSGRALSTTGGTPSQVVSSRNVSVLRAVTSRNATPQRRSPRSVSASFSVSPKRKQPEKPAPKKRRRNVSPIPNLEEVERLGRVTRLRAKQIQVPASKKKTAADTQQKSKTTKSAPGQLPPNRTRDVNAAIDALRSRFQLSRSQFVQLWLSHSGNLENMAASLLANEKRMQNAKGSQRPSKSSKNRVETTRQSTEAEEGKFEWTIELDCLLHEFYMTEDEPLSRRYYNALCASLPTDQHKLLIERNRFLRQFAQLVRLRGATVTHASNLYSLEPRKRTEVASNAAKRIEREASGVA